MAPRLLVVLLCSSLRGSCLSRPAPQPLPPAFAQGLIAALTLAHTGIIAYALHKDNTQSAKLIGEQAGRQETD